MKHCLLIRVATGPAGWGHLTRCLAVAQAWRERGGKVVFALRRSEICSRIQGKLAGPDFKICELPAENLPAEILHLKTLIEELQPAWVLLDGYEFDDAYEQDLTSGGTPLVVFDDDRHAVHRSAHGLINGNAYASPDFYALSDDGLSTLSRKSSTESPRDKTISRNFHHSRLGAKWHLLGPKYLPLRSDFWDSLSNQRQSLEDMWERIVVPLGGKPSPELLGGVLTGLSVAIPKLRNPPHRIDIIAGALPADERFLEDLKGLLPGVELNFRIDPPNLVELFRNATLAISAGGSTLYELARCGVPTIAFPVSDNQTVVVDALHRLKVVVPTNNPCLDNGVGLAQALGQVFDIDNEALRQWRARAECLVDGQGARRIAEILNLQPISLRRATENDADFLFDLRNDELVRENSLQQDSVSWEQHLRWLKSKLGDSRTTLFIVESRLKQPIGQVRFDFDSSETAMISISLAQSTRGLGLAAPILQMAMGTLHREKTVSRFRALIRPENSASIKTFLACGFRQEIVESGDQCQPLEFWFEP
jgi:UDP-2,4-diacetamido-2,4,6-trideoxy-beta-L-altropyranose hydrolase